MASWRVGMGQHRVCSLLGKTQDQAPTSPIQYAPPSTSRAKVMLPASVRHATETFSVAWTQ